MTTTTGIKRADLRRRVRRFDRSWSEGETVELRPGASEDETRPLLPLVIEDTPPPRERDMNAAQAIPALDWSRLGGLIDREALVGDSRTPDHPFQPLQQAGAYAIHSELGRGGMGVVYRARHQDGSWVALKVLRGGHRAPLDDLVRFQREAELTARLTHPNIVRLREHGQLPDGHWFMALELVDGEDLIARIERQGRLPAREAAAIALALAEAAQSVHDAGALHRDIKPHNVLLADDGTPVLSDFGLAKVPHKRRLTGRGTVLGTPAYMSPEQAAGQDEVDARTDVYCLGATLFHMLSGDPPWDPQALAALLRGERGVSPGVDDQLEAIVVACLQRDPARRHPSAAALASALRAWLARQPSARARATTTAWIPSPRRRTGPALGPLALALALALTLALAVGALVLAS